MYFKDRHEAGAKLAAQLVSKYRYENTAILALSDGGVLVAEEIARQLHTMVSLLLTEPITLPGMQGEPIGLIDQEGRFTHNQMISTGQLEELMSEMRVILEEEKMQELYKVNRLLGESGEVDPHTFYGKYAIIVSDGLKNGMSFEAAVNFLKPINTLGVVAAVPLVSVPAVDRLHILCDDICVLNVVGNYLETDHYYDNNDLRDAELIRKRINEVVTSWA
jgi:putative phosphoribosyl transferase